MADDLRIISSWIIANAGDPGAWVAGTISIGNLWLAGRKIKWCWIVSFCNAWIYMYVNIRHGLWGYLPMGFVSMFMTLRNFYIWHKDEETKDEMASVCAHCGLD